jgi:hypothetical protein
MKDKALCNVSNRSWTLETISTTDSFPLLIKIRLVLFTCKNPTSSKASCVIAIFYILINFNLYRYLIKKIEIISHIGGAALFPYTLPWKGNSFILV